MFNYISNLVLRVNKRIPVADVLKGVLMIFFKLHSILGIVRGYLI